MNPVHGGPGEPRQGWVRAGVAVAVRPQLWGSALTQLRRLAPRRWWRRRPFLPVPDQAYLEFRAHTQRGGAAGEAGVSADEIVEYLRWCRSQRRR